MAIYDGIPIRGVTKSAYREMAKFGMSLDDIQSILEEGYDCARGKRPNVVERCARRKEGTIKVVVEKIISFRGLPYWRVRHVGKI